LTGVNFVTAELVAKRLELLRELVPGAHRIAVLVNPADTANTEPTLRDMEAAARAIGLQLEIYRASTSREIDAAFTSMAQERPEALFVGNASSSSSGPNHSSAKLEFSSKDRSRNREAGQEAGQPLQRELKRKRRRSAD
jgi:ABC-type uncharacterized transport system substrate-binding protein